MTSKKLTLLFLICLVAIAIQALVFHTWNTGILNQFKLMHRSFDNQLPEFVRYAMKTSKHWCLAPLFSLLTLCLTTFIKSKPKLIYVPLDVSVGLALYMLYVM